MQLFDHCASGQMQLPTEARPAESGAQTG